ncbi:unnamed protein product [Mucor hiemalis]
MFISNFRILLLNILLKSLLILQVAAFYGDPFNQFTIPSTYRSAAININNKIYLFGGLHYEDNRDIVPNLDVLVYSFSSNGTLQFQTLSPKNPPNCQPCVGYALPDGDTIAFLNVAYPSYNEITIYNTTETISVGGLGFYHISNNSWTLGRSPQYSGVYSLLRDGFMSGISASKKSAYIGWGHNGAYSSVVIKFDISNSSNLQSIETNVTALGGCSVTLPSGMIVTAFGEQSDNVFYNSSQVMLFDTNTDSFSWKQVQADRAIRMFPHERVYASCALGPDNSTIYYYGGTNTVKQYNVTLYNDVAMLDTKNWIWILPKDIPGVNPLPASETSMVLFDRSIQGNFITGSISVLNNVPLSTPSNEQASNLQWFTNDSKYDKGNENYGLSNGAIAGIVIAILVFIAVLLILLWMYIPATKRVAAYIQQDLIWSPRSGEPLWAETTRLLVRFVLLFLFLAFIVYVVWKSVNSATVSQHISNPVDSVLAPDIRFCFNGFDQSNASVTPYVTCTLRNGTNCSGSIRPLDLSKKTPNYNFYGTSCFLFLPGPSYYITNDAKDYRDRTGTKMIFNFFAQNTTADITSGVIYIDFYAPGYDANTDTYGFGASKLSEVQKEQWNISEQTNNAVNTIILKQTVESTASYTLTTVKKLKPNDGWNYIGFSSNYDEYLDISSSFKELPQNPMKMPINFDKPIAQLTVQPEAFTENSDVDQRVFTLINAFAQAGGVLGLFVALQTILFGFRPQSPWGIVHRWSFGKLRIKLTDRLANYFDRMGTPVPLVNPVSNRLRNVNGHSYFKTTDNTYVPLGADTPSANEISELNDQEDRVHRVEERLQLMELLLKSYYLNDEVFRSLDQAVKRGNEGRQQGILRYPGNNDTDSVLNNNATVNEDLTVNPIKGDVNIGTATELNRGPSSTVFSQQREPYQPGLAPNPLDFSYTEGRNNNEKN